MCGSRCPLSNLRPQGPQSPQPGQNNPASFRQTFIDSFADIPEKVLVGTPRGASLKFQLDQGRLLQYFARAGQAIDVGVAFSVDNFQVEYWFNLALQPQPDGEDLSVCVSALQALWFERLQELAPQIAQQVNFWESRIIDLRCDTLETVW
jgi:hypothetical protein